MKSISKLFSTFSSSIRKGGTGTALDVLDHRDSAPAIADWLLTHDRTPATRSDIVAAWEAVEGRVINPEELEDAEAYLLTLGFVQ